MGEKVQRLLLRAILAFAGLITVTAGAETVYSRQASESPQVNQESNSVMPLAVTELFRDGVGDLDSLVYIELYNSSARLVELENVILQTGLALFELESPARIPAGEMILISNRNIPGVSEHQIWLIPELQLSTNSGEISLREDGRVLISVFYGELPARYGMELNRVSDVLARPARSQDYQPSAADFLGGYYGSPGAPGSTRRAYIYEVSPGSWDLISLPGVISSGLEEESPSEDLSGRGYIITSSDSTRKIVVEERMEPVSVEKRVNSENSWFLAGNPYSKPYPLHALEWTGGSLSSRVVQVWNAEDQTFELRSPGDSLGVWEAGVVQNESATSLHFSPGKPGLGSPAESPIGVRFTLETKTGLDRAVRLMFHEGGSHGIDSLDTEKLWPLTVADPEPSASILFFLNRSDSPQTLLAQDSRPFNLEKPIEVDMGHLHTGTSGEQRIRWSGLESLPAEWDLNLTDLATGLEVDLRELDELVFQVSDAGNAEKPELGQSGIYWPSGDQVTAPRFRLAVVPAQGMEISAAGSTGPAKVELHPNYPNPFQGATTIEFHLPEPMPVVVSVYNIVGQRVGQLMDGEGTSGQNDIVWDASEMPSGIYIVRLETPSATLTRKMTLIK